MKVKIKNTIYDSENEPIMLILSAQDRLNILGMRPNATKYIAYTDDISDDRIDQFINETPEKPLYVGPPSAEIKDLAKKLVVAFNNNKTVLRAIPTGCCGNTVWGISNVEVLLRSTLEEVFCFTSDELNELICGK